jgi:hypothetical protein
VDAAEAFENLRAGAKEEVVGVREEDLGAGGFEGLRELGLDRGLGADGHEEGGENLVVEGGEAGGAGLTAGGLGFELEVEAGWGHED